jgi:hypothetical protein
MNELKVYLYALGVGIATSLALIPDSGDINWRSVGVAGAKAVLYSLGITALVTKTTQK